ncbi:putative Vacuolar sorting associated 13 protein C terminal [Trypanosoma vivax]|nr:putative Vacuolar sorting associated 13 protein C terminal [Trypanosoma vivax]
MHDILGINVHTASFSDLHVEMSPSGDVDMTLRSLTVVEHFTNKPLVETRGDGVLTLRMSSAEKTTSVDLGDMNFMLVPKAIGSLLNMLLSVQFPSPLPSAEAQAANCSPLSSGRASSQLAAPAVFSTTGVELASRFVAKLNYSCVVAILGDRNVFMAEFYESTLDLQTFVDTSSTLTTSVGWMTVRDTFSSSTQYSEIVKPMCDRNDSDACVLELSLVRYPSRVEHSEDECKVCCCALPPSYTQHFRCHLTSLTIVFIPDVSYAAMNVITDIQGNMSDVNRGKAYDYVADKTAQTLQERVELMKVEVAIDRSRIILVDSSESTNTIEVFPGDFFIQNKLSCETVFYADDTVDAAVGETSAEGKAGVCGTDASASTSIHREVFSMNINRMSLNVLGTSAFSHSDRINLSLSRFVGECSPKDKAKSSVTSSLAVPGLTRLETTCVTISVPVLSSKLTQAQLNYILDVMGAFRCLGTEGHSYGEGAAILASSTSQVASAYQDGAGSVFGGGTPMTASFPTCTTGRKRAHDASQCLQGLNGVGTGLLASGEAQPGAIGCNSNRNGGIGSAKKDRPLSFTARLQRLETNIDDKFDLVIDSLDVSCATGSGNISYTETGSHSVTYPSSTVATKLSLDAIVLRHHNPKNNHAKRKGINEADDHRGYSSMECQSYPFFMNCVSITSKSVTNAEGSTSRTETSTTIVLNRAHTTITPLMLTDVREVLYGPFCAKVFRVPLSPIPVYKLTDSVHVLNSDLTLDASHILVTASKTRCCYTLDLNQYKLYLTGYPSAQLALEDNCQLTITNGCVVVPGMYSLSSFVSFGANASLFTSRSCIVEKHSPIDHVDTSLPRISKGRSRGGMESSVGSMSKLMSISPMETHKPQLLSSSLLQPQLGATSLNSTLTSTKNQVTPVPVPTTDNELLTLVNLRCNELSLFVLAEDVEDIGIRVNMSPSCHYKQRVENGLAKERTLCLDLKDIHTGVREEVLLLNTDLNISVVGIDTICVTGTFESLGMCLRVSLLRSLVELGKDIAAALTSKSDVQLNAPAVTLENEYLQPLVAVKAVGECRICGCSSASIAESRGECGVLCYRCCTGKSTLPETTVRAEIQQLDVLFLGDRGGMLQLRLPNSTKVTFSAEQGVSFHVRMQLRNLNQSAAVWEPLVERFEANVVANIQTSSFKLDVDKLDYVVSPENVRLLKELAEDFSPTSELQRQLRRKGWASAEPPSRNLVTVESRNRGHGSVAVGAVDEDEEGVEGRHTLPEEQCPVPEVCEMPCSLVGGQESVKDCVSNNFTAHIIFENLFSDPVEFEGMTADPCGGILKFHTTKHYGVLRCEVNKDAAATSGGITINWVRPPLYVRGPDVMVEVKVQLTCRKQDNQISRIVRLRCFPIHSSSMIICFRNNVTSPIEVIQGRPAVPPHGQLYFNRDFPLDEPLQLRPLKMGDERYSTVVTAATLSTPTLRGLLNTPTTMLQFKSNQKKTNLFAVKATVKQEAFRAGIPMFIIALEPQIFIENHLPYNLHVYIHTDSSKHKGCTSTELGSLFLEPSQSEGVMLGETNVEQALFHIELHQKAEHGAFVPYCTSTSFSLTRRSTVLTLKSTIDDSQMSVIARYADHKVTLSTPYSIVNFSPLDMEVRECTESGALVQPKNMNFNLLPGSMQTAYAAAPNDVDSKEFFVTVTVSSFTSAAVPLHLQDRGTIILELRDSAKLSNHKKGGRSRGDDVGENNVLQFMYSTQIDMYGSRFVTIVPRWIIVNRTPRPLYIVQAVLEPSSGQVTGCSGTRGTKGSSTSPLFASTSSKSSVRSERRFQCRVDLAQLSPPNSATPLFVTQKNSAEVGYAVFVLQSKDAVVHGDPVSLEEIASTLVLAHGSSGVAYTEGSNILVETSVVVDGPYTFFTLQEPAVPPFILLNRTLLSLALYNAYGQLLAQVEPGCITPFVVDARDRTSRTQVCLASECATASTDTEARCESRRSERPSSPFAEFNFNQHMTPEEANNPLDIEFVVNLGSFGQQIIELNHISGWRAPVLDHDDSISTNLASPEQERNLARSGSCGLVDCGLYCYRSAPPASFDAMVILSQLSVSLVTTDREIIFGVIDNVSVHLSRHGTKEILKLSVKNLQLDNQCELNPVYEVCCMAIRSSLEVPCFSLYVERTVVPAPAVLFVDEVRLDIVPIAVRLSDNILAAVGTFVSQLITDTSVRHTALTEQELFDSAPMTVGAMNTHVILERMVVNPLIAHLWFERDDGRNLIREHVRRRTAVLISMIPSCENVQVSMPGLAIERRVGSADALLRWLLQAYVTNLRRQIYELLFQYASSLPLLGAPIRLVSGVGSGALRFFHDPISGLTTSPKAFAMGFASGSSALLTEVVSGGLGAVSNLAKTGADIMDAVANNSRRSARSKGSGVNLFRGIASAVSGVVTKPLEGAVESGAKGLVRGMGYGLLGVVANPVAGLLSDVSRVTSTAAQLCDDSYVPSVKRMRKLRDFHASGAVADFQSVISVYEHERGEYNGSRWVSSDAWLPTDGPKWHPHKLDQMRHPQGGTIQTESWQIAYYGANFEGWKFGKKYHGVYAADTVSSAHLRRRRWVAVMYALPPSYLLHLVPQFVEDGPSIYASPGASTVACLPTPMLADRQPGERSLPAAHGTVTGAATETSGEKPMGTQSDSLPGSDEVVVKLYQYESKVPFFGWSTRFLPADCAGWQDSEGRPAPRRADYPLPSGWSWVDEWNVVGKGMENEYEYLSMAVPKAFKLRRRCWTRTMRKTS